MKNNRQNQPIKREDFNSPLMCKAFWKLIRRESLFVFCLKVLLAGTGLIGLILLISLLGTLSEN